MKKPPIRPIIKLKAKVAPGPIPQEEKPPKASGTL